MKVQNLAYGFLLVLSYIFNQVVACPYANYEDGLLPPYNPISVENRVFTLDNSKSGDSIAFGYWSFCIPLWEVPLYPTVQSQFKSQAEDGQFMFSVQPLNEPQPMILGYLSFDSANLLANHNIYSSNVLQKFSYSTATYEGYWIFTLFTFQPQSQSLRIEMTDQQPFIIDYKGQLEVTITIGGRGYITMNTQGFNLNIFRGRLSKIILEPQFSFDTNKFTQLSTLCKIPPKVIGEQTTFIVQGYKKFNEDRQLQFIIDQVGNRYCLSGWIKFDFSSAIKETIYTVVRLSAFKNYKKNDNFGDALFFYYVYILKDYPQGTLILVTTSPYSIPKKGLTDYDYDEFKNYNHYFIDGSNTNYFQGLQQWHYLQYEYGRTGVGEEKMLVKIFFFNELGLQQGSFGNARRRASFINSNFYLFFGGDDDSQVLLKAQIFDFKFQYNYMENKKFMFEICHYSCLQCNGPLVNNCIACDPNSFRVLLTEQQICECQENYIDYDGNRICQQFLGEYQSVEENEISAQLDSQCQAGYFQIKGSINQCVQCPQQNFNFRLCVDCLYYPLTWFETLQCTIDLVTIEEDGDNAYKLYQRKSIDYDLYVLDQTQNLILIEGAQEFCYDTSISNCHETNYKHQGNLVNVICKPNYYFFQSECLKADPQCLESDQFGLCLKCYDGMYLKNNSCLKCPINCLTCKFQNQIICQSCLQRFTLHNGQCLECGSHCLICKYFEDLIINSAYLRCYKCVNDSLYMLTLDGKNCLPNPIKDCIYAFQGLKSDITINSLDYYYIPQQDSSDIVAYCGLCILNYVFVTSTYQCIDGHISNCDFGYVINPTDYNIFCLIALPKWTDVMQFQDYCEGYAKNCKTCIYGKQTQYKKYITCLICQAGYYLDKLSEKCLKCPVDLLCYQCMQQDSFSKDGWKDKIRAFYRKFIDKVYTHPYVMYGQSQNPNDYEVVCTMCKDGYQLYQNKCILTCPTSCLECMLINGENVCVRCQSEENGRRLSFVNNQCIKCPTNCALCRQRSVEEISKINPFFNNSDFYFYTYQCLKSFNNQYYDQEIGQFIECTDIQNGCQRQFTIPITLYCSEQEYNYDMSQYTNEMGKKIFKQKNILITELFSGNSFSEFYNYEFYQMANQKYVKKIQIQIKGNGQQTCELRGTSIATQSFSANIFSAIDVELEMKFEEKTIFIYDRTLIFKNFKKITIDGLTLQPLSNDRLKQLHFTGSQIIILNKIVYQQLGNKDQSQIIFENLQSLLIDDMQIMNLVQSNIDFIQIQKTDKTKDIVIKSLKISNCLFSNQIMFLFNLGFDDAVTFQNIEIESTFNNVSLISSLDSTQMAQLYISKFTLSAVINNCEAFFDIYKFLTIDIEKFLFRQSKIVNSQVLYLNAVTKLSFFTIKDSSFTVNSLFIKNSDLLLDSSFKITFLEMIFENNKYDETSKLILLKHFGSVTSEIQLTQLKMLGNSAISISKNFNSESIDAALVYLQFQFITLYNMNIERGFGLIDLSISDALKITMQDIKITQHKNFIFKGLHQYLDCQLKQVSGQSFWSSLYIFQTKIVEITNLEITGVIIYNQPLIIFQSANLAIIQYQESIDLKNILSSQNLLLLTESSKQTTLFKFSSQQDINLKIRNTKFLNNLLHEYVQNQETDSTALLFVDFSQGSVSIQDSQFHNNLVTNSSDSIFNIRGNKILIQSCQFQNNSVFKYEILQPYLLWGFPKEKKINQSSIASIFPVKSKSGNGLMSGIQIMISDIVVNSSSASFGGGFHVTAQNQAVIQLQNCSFSNLDSLFSAQDESGGVIFLDGQNSQSFTLQMNNISASHINCRNKGGLLFVVAGLSKAFIQVIEVHVQDVYSSYGSILFVEFSNLATNSQKLKVQGLNIKNTYQGQINFLNKFTNILLSESSILINNRSAFQVNFGHELIFQNINIQDLLLESAFYLSNAIKIEIVQTTIFNCSTSRNLVNIIANPLSKSNTVISKFIAFNNNIGQIIDFKFCPQIFNSYQQIFFQCIQNPIQPPQKLDQDQKQNLDNCLINKMDIAQDLANSGLIVFTQLNVLSQLKLEQITLENIDCQNCEQGLISAIYPQTENILRKLNLLSISITNSLCGKSSCVIFSNGQIPNTRILQENLIYQLGYELIINHYDCLNNSAVNGTCLMVTNLKTLITKSNFKGNKASLSGGSVYIRGNKLFIIQDSLISENTAFQGGGYFLDQLMINQTKLKTVIEGNKATFYGDDQVSSPTEMSVMFNDKLLDTQIIQKNDQIQIDEVKIKPYSIPNQIKNVLYLPSGQEVSSYQYYDWKNSTYVPFNWQFRLVALNQEKIIQRNLSNTECVIQSRLYQKDEDFSSKYTNMQKVYFNDSTQDYNLNNLIIYFNPEADNNTFLQLQFSCTSIKIPVYNTEYPFNIESYHQNYYLRLNIRSLACQLGEIKQNDSCILCDFNQGLFSTELNSKKCSVLDDISTISVKSASLNIRPGFWRPYIDTSFVSYCLNLPENCLGGWTVGDTSCYLGHIGALCEQCDLYNIRGHGSFSISTSYTCGHCESMIRNGLLIAAISIWTLITILISVYSTLTATKQFAKIINLQKLGIAVSLETSQSAILIKMLTNFLQILATISTFQLALPIALDNTINGAGNPIQTMTYSLDCLLIRMFNFEIHYSRMIWQLILPFIYISLFITAYLIGVKGKIFEFNASVITTTLIYLYIYLQPNILGGLVQLISFRKISGYSWIQANISFRYDTTYHYQWIIRFCLPIILIIALLIPIYMIVGLYFSKEKLNNNRTMLKWGYLYIEYRKGAYLWEIVKIVEKELIIFFLTFYSDNIVIKGILIQTIILIYYQLNKKYSPYQQKGLNYLDALSAQVCIISVGLGVGIYISQQSELQEIRIPFFLILSIVNAIFLTTIISRIIIEYIREDDHQEILDTIRDYIRRQCPFLMYIPNLKRILKNKTEQRKRVRALYKKAKQFLLIQARQIMALKEQQREVVISQLTDSAQHTLRSSRESAERQRLFRNNSRLCLLNNKEKSVSSLTLEKIKLNRLNQMPAILEIGEGKQSPIITQNSQ